MLVALNWGLILWLCCFGCSSVHQLQFQPPAPKKTVPQDCMPGARLYPSTFLQQRIRIWILESIIRLLTGWFISTKNRQQKKGLQNINILSIFWDLHAITCISCSDRSSKTRMEEIILDANCWRLLFCAVQSSVIPPILTFFLKKKEKKTIVDTHIFHNSYFNSNQTKHALLMFSRCFSSLFKCVALWNIWSGQNEIKN